MNSEDEHVVENLEHPQKRRRNVKEWKKNKAKLKRYSGEGKSPTTNCNHEGPRSYCRKQDLQPEDIRDAFEEFYLDSDKQRQDLFLASLLILTPVKRTRVAENQRKRNIQYTIHYQLTNQDGYCHEVCSKTFLAIFCVSPDRVKGLAAHKWATNSPRPERRGGVRMKSGYADLKEEIKEHISKFRCVSSHYGKGKTPHKKCLPSHLNVMKMYKLFLQNYKGPVDVKYSFYYNIFVTCFKGVFRNTLVGGVGNVAASDVKFFLIPPKKETNLFDLPL